MITTECADCGRVADCNPEGYCDACGCSGCWLPRADCECQWDEEDTEDAFGAAFYHALGGESAR